MPIDWEEPFGLVMVDAPSDIVEDGVTGFRCDDEDEMARSLERVDRIDRRRCREVPEERFSTRARVDSYEGLIGRLAARR